ncbi:MAG: hypothetical protein HKP35_02730 [Silicimonas sp.]|nr:hypothetical protein [Silicimonas sp.]
MLRFLFPAILAAVPASATEFTFSVPMKSGPLLGEIATGTIDLQDGVYTGTGTEIFAAPGSPIQNAGDIVRFDLNVLTLTFTEADRIGNPIELRITFQDGVVTQFHYSGALFDPGASAFLTISHSVNKADLRTTGGKGEQLQSIGSPFTFVQNN